MTLGLVVLRPRSAVDNEHGDDDEHHWLKIYFARQKPE
jgi:hypothetical protein